MSAQTPLRPDGTPMQSTTSKQRETRTESFDSLHTYEFIDCRELAFEMEPPGVLGSRTNSGTVARPHSTCSIREVRPLSLGQPGAGKLA